MKRWRRPGSIPILGRARLTLATFGRYPRLGWNLALGRFNRMQTQGWWLLLSTVVFVGIPLIVLGLVGLGGWWTSWLGVVVSMLIVLFLRWVLQTRGRVIVESFVDYTKEDAKAVSGLSTLLVTELGRLRELYQQIEDLSVPTSVGVESHGGFGRGKEAGVFLTVSADDATSVLEDAVASDAGISVGAAKFSLKPILTFLNRVTRGPRVVGSVHLTEAGGGPTLTAQLIGKGQCMTWRIEQRREPESPEQRKAFLDTMVHELACRMFTQLTLHGSVRPKAVEAFNDYMNLYDDVRRTSHDRAFLLKEAQGKLLEAVAQDEQFDLAYYNLGVIYMQLAHTERLADLESDDATSQTRLDRSELDAARGEAARVAFQRALSKNPDRWEAFYALGVTTFSEIRAIEIDESPGEKQRERLDKVIALCDQALAVAPNRHASLAAIYDLRGMAQTRLAKDFGKAILDHRRAVHHSWIEYCQARRRDAARTDGLPDLVAHARANGAAALHDLALAHERRALLERAGSKNSLGRDRLELRAAHRHFRRAARLAGHGSALTAATRYEKGLAFDRARKYEKAARELRLAKQIHTRSCEHHARLSQALAGRRQQLTGRDDRQAAELEREARTFAGLALKLLARPFSLAVLPLATGALVLRCEATLDALEEAYERLGDREEAQRIGELKTLQKTLEAALSEADPQTGRPSKPERSTPRAESLEERRSELRAARVEAKGPRPDEEAPGDPRTWQLDQVELAIGRLYADDRNWERANDVFGGLVDRLKREKRTKRIVEFGAYAHLARALREHQPKGRESLVEALDIAAEGIRRAPLDVESRREAGRAHFALNQFSEALDAWEHALWLSPSDPYLHYETAMSHRELARDQTDEEARQLELDCARFHFEKAQELFDGEDLDGEAWTRFWRGKIALEADAPMEGLEYLKGAEHGSAEAAAALLLGEAHLRLDQRPAADHAFARCEQALQRAGNGEETTSTLAGRATIDALWGDELPEIAVRARIARGRAEAQHLAPGDWQSSDGIEKAEGHLEEARDLVACLRRVQPDATTARDEVETRILETQSRIFQAQGEIEDALEGVRERLRYKKTEEAQRLEAELLELSAAEGSELKDDARRRLAAKHVKRSLPRGRRRRPAPPGRPSGSGDARSGRV